ncbi:MAG: hypothetical protein K9W42_11380 [Candidatus Heimdallarchaeota archaeon]|nr:hypothetical protein [Candidatus Heimdallarchaeota archaeon]
MRKKPKGSFALKSRGANDRSYTTHPKDKLAICGGKMITIVTKLLGTKRVK